MLAFVHLYLCLEEYYCRKPEPKNRPLAKKRKWSREECRLRYVQGEAIGQRALAEQSGRAASVIAAWCSEDGWVQQREQYQSNLRAETQKKTIEKTSDRLSDDLAKRNEDHVRGFEVIRAGAIQFNKTLLTELQKSDRKLKLLDEKSMSFQRYATAYKLAVEGERQALGMEYMDSNKAIAKVIKDGYDVIEPELE